MRCPSATHRAISRMMVAVATPAPPPIFTTSVMIVLLHGMQTRKGQAQGFVPTTHAVECLHCISGSALHQIIQSGDDYHSLLLGVKFEANITIVAPRQNLRFWLAIYTVALLDQANEWYMMICLPLES